MTDIEDSKALQEFRRSIFRHYIGGEAMAQAYLSQLRKLVDSADAVLGIRESPSERSAFWLEGHVLGCLTCTGENDGNAQINGWVLRLDDVAKIDLEVDVVIKGPWDDSPGVSGRVLKLNGGTLLSASPHTARLPDKLAEIDQFIDRILAIFASRTQYALGPQLDAS
jgi:hypothetical protein